MASYTLFGQANLGITSQSSTARLTIGCEFEVSTSVALTGIWWFPAPGGTGMPSQCVIFDILAASMVPGTLNTSPTWVGGGAGTWNKCSYDGSVTLVSGKKYQVCIFQDGSVNPNWFNSVAGYWTSGPGASGITNGPLSAPNNASSNGGQDMVQSGGLSITLPNIPENGKNYGVDVEVSDLQVTVTGTVANVSVQAPAGSASISMPGSPASVSVQAVAGSLSVNVTGTTASSQVAAPSGSVSINISGTTSRINVSAPPGSVFLTNDIDSVSGSLVTPTWGITVLPGSNSNLSGSWSGIVVTDQ